MEHNNTTKKRGTRDAQEIRPIKITYNICEYAAASALFELGKTKILCAISMQNQVPHFLKGKKEGWLTCEYALLPMSTDPRSTRQSTGVQRNGRSVEISRFIGRVLRSVMDFSVFPDKTITVDCDVIHADGSTRVASINAASLCLEIAQEYWLNKNTIQKPFLKERIYALSIGTVENKIYVDLDTKEDNVATSDFNFVISASNQLIEILGGSEKQSLAWDQFEEIQKIAKKAVIEVQNSIAEAHTVSLQNETIVSVKKAPLFGLQNRLMQK